MPEMKVGDPPATLRAVEKEKGVQVPVTGSLNWALTPADGSLAELAPGDTGDTVKLVAKGAGTVTASVADPAFGLSATLDVVISAPAPVPDSIEIQFEPGQA